MKRKTDPLDSVAGQILENAKKSGLEINTAEDAERVRKILWVTLR